MNRDEEKGPEPQVGMQAEATQGDLGEADVSKPRVKHVQRDEAGQVVSMVIQKGVLLRKEMEVPAERIEQITQASRGEGTGTAIVQMSQQETEALTSQGSETVSAPTDALGQVEERLPTAEGLRRQERQSQTRKPAEQVKRSWWQVLGPGFLSGMAGNDASAVGAYAIDGAQVGLAHLWLMILATPLYQAVQYSCAKIGRVTGKGLADVLCEHYGRPLAALASLVLPDHLLVKRLAPTTINRALISLSSFVRSTTFPYSATMPS